MLDQGNRQALDQSSVTPASEAAAQLLKAVSKYEYALARIWDIVHTPTKDTNYKSAVQHFSADFDAIRAAIRFAGLR